MYAPLSLQRWVSYPYPEKQNPVSLSCTLLPLHILHRHLRHILRRNPPTDNLQKGGDHADGNQWALIGISVLKLIISFSVRVGGERERATSNLTSKVHPSLKLIQLSMQLWPGQTARSLRPVSLALLSLQMLTGKMSVRMREC